MFCTNCGTKLVDDAKFCFNCGAKIISMIPVEQEPVYETPVVNEPVVEEPTYEAPVVNEPVVEEPIIEEPTSETPIISEPVIEEPTYETPIMSEPVIEEPTYETPVMSEPVVEEPVYETPVVEESVVEIPVMEIPVDTTPVYETPVTPVYTEPAAPTPVYETPVTPVYTEPAAPTPVAPTYTEPVAPTPIASYIPQEPVPAPVAPAPKKAKKKKKHTGLKVFFILLLLLILAYVAFAALVTFKVVDVDLPDPINKAVDFSKQLTDLGVLKPESLPEEEEEEFLTLIGYWDKACAEQKEKYFNKAFEDYVQDYVLAAYNAGENELDVDGLLQGMYERYFEEAEEYSETCSIYKKYSKDELDDVRSCIKKATGEKLDITKAYIIENTTSIKGGKKDTLKDKFLFYQVDDDDWCIIPIVGEQGEKDFNLD